MKLTRAVPLALAALTLLLGSLTIAETADAQAATVYFSEIFYNPSGQDEGHEFLELHNVGDQAVDVSGWVISGDVDLTLAPGTTIEPDSYLAFAADSADFLAEWGVPAADEFSGGLKNGGSSLTLTDATGVVVDNALWDDVEPWPVSADGDGDSLGRLGADSDGVTPASWLEATPTPGAPNLLNAAVLFSVERGWYFNDQVVTLASSVPGGTIYYSTDGSGDADTEYTGPITVESDREVRVIQASVEVNGQESAVDTHSYVFGDDDGIPRVVIWDNSLPDAPGESESTRHFEFIPPPSTGLIAAGADVGLEPSSGGVSAGRSDKIFFRSAYGTGTFRADLFSDFYYGRPPVQQIDQLFLRNRHLDPTEAKQMVAHDSLNAAGQLSPHGRYVRMWELGTSKDFRYLHERPEGGFMEAYTGIDKDFWQAEAGDIPQQPGDTWAEIERDWNVESFIDFSLVQWQANVWDYWDDRNYRMAGPIGPGDGGDYRNHFFNWDMDHGYTGASPYYWAGAAFQSPQDMIDELDVHVQFGLLFQDRTACALFDGGPLTAEASEPRLQARFDELRAADGPSNSASQWVDWIENRNEAMIDDFRDRGDPLLGERDPVTVDISQGVLTITGNEGYPIWYRLDGGDVRTPTGELSPAAVSYNGPVALAAGRHRVVARSFDSTESLAVDKWSPACTEVDPVDVAVTGNVGASPGEGLVINELHYNPPTVGVISGGVYEYIELFNSTDTAINMSEFSFASGVDWTAPAGTTIDAGEYFVIAASAVSFAEQHGQAPDAVYDGRLNDGGESVALADATGVVFDEVSYLDVAPWPTAPDAQGPSLALIDPSLDNSLPQSWAASSQDAGSPFAANEVLVTTPPTGDVDCDADRTTNDVQMILEFMADVRTDSNGCALPLGTDRANAREGNINGDAQTDLRDALQLSQCLAGTDNGVCPEGMLGDE